MTNFNAPTDSYAFSVPHTSLAPTTLVFHVQNYWKLEHCYKPLESHSISENSTSPSTLSPAKKKATNGLQSDPPLVDLVHSDRECVTSPAAVASVNCDQNKADVKP